MTIAKMLGQSAMLTLLGMGVVFSFLIILIFAMYLLHAVVHAIGADKESADTSSAAPTAAAPADNGAVVAAIAAALKQTI